MTEVRESELPGVGIRHEFTTTDGVRLSVVTHRSGRRELCVANRDDPDAFRPVVILDEEDSRTLAELLGASAVVRDLHDLKQRVEGLAIDWLPVREDSPYAGATIGDARIRTRTGVSVVAVIRGDDTLPAPGPQQGLRAGDYLVVVGTPRGIEDLVTLLRAG